MRPIAIGIVVCLVAGCGGEAERAPEPGPPEREAPPTKLAEPEAPEARDPTAADPLLDELGADPAPGEDVAAPIATPLIARPAPPRGCALQVDAPARVIEGGGAPAIAAHRDASGAVSFLVAAITGSSVAIVRARPGAAPQPFATIALESAPRGATPALAITGDREATIAFVDGRGRVLVATFDPTLPATAPIAREIAESGADVRFAPAIRATGDRRAIAWTDGSATPMRLRVAILGAGARRDEVAMRHDVTPVAGGGAAPSFVEGEDAAVLMFLDPRVGISVAHRVALGPGGAPAPTEVSRPLNLASEPPAIAAVRTPSRTWLAYAAVGNGATRAVGLVDAVGTERPAPLVSGLGYGDPLTIDALAQGDVAIFATEAPSAVPADAPHEVRVRVVSADGAGEALTIAAPAIDPAIARADDGLLGLAVRGAADVFVHYLRCDG